MRPSSPIQCENINKLNSILSDLEQQIEQGNLLDQRISLHSVFVKANVAQSSIYQHKATYSCIVNRCATIESKRILKLLNLTLDEIEQNFNAYVEKKSFSLTLEKLLQMSKVTDSLFNTVTEPIDALIARQEKLRETLKQAKDEFKKSKRRVTKIA